MTCSEIAVAMLTAIACSHRSSAALHQRRRSYKPSSEAELKAALSRRAAAGWQRFTATRLLVAAQTPLCTAGLAYWYHYHFAQCGTEARRAMLLRLLPSMSKPTQPAKLD